MKKIVSVYSKPVYTLKDWWRNSSALFYKDGRIELRYPTKKPIVFSCATSDKTFIFQTLSRSSNSGSVHLKDDYVLITFDKGKLTLALDDQNYSFITKNSSYLNFSDETGTLLLGIGLTIGLGIATYFFLNSMTNQSISSPDQLMTLFEQKATSSQVPMSNVLQELRHVDLAKASQRITALSRHKLLFKQIYEMTMQDTSDLVLTLLGFKLTSILVNSDAIFDTINTHLGTTFVGVRLPYNLEGKSSTIFAERDVLSTWFSPEQGSYDITHHIKSMHPEDVVRIIGEALLMHPANIHIDNFLRFSDSILTPKHVHAFLMMNNPSATPEDAFQLHAYLFSRFPEQSLVSDTILSALNQHTPSYDMPLNLQRILSQFQYAVSTAIDMHSSCATPRTTQLHGHSRRCYVPCDKEFAAKQVIEDVVADILDSIYKGFLAT